MTAPATRPGGRSARVRAAVLEAFLDLLVEQGYAHLTLEGLAARAGVNKTTLYRRWGDRAGVLLDAALATADDAVPVPDTGAAADDLLALAREVAANLRSPRAQAMARTVIAEAQADAEVADAARRFWHERLTATGVIVERGIERGEVRSGTDPARTIEALVGPLYLRVLVTQEPVDDDFLADHAAWVAAAIAPPASP